MSEKEEYPVLVVTWLDHTANAGWIENIDKETYEEAVSIGWLVQEDKTCIKLANTLTKESGIGGISVILKSCITEMWTIDFDSAVEVDEEEDSRTLQ